MLRLIKRTASEADKSPIVLSGSATASFGNTGTDTGRGLYHLLTGGILSKIIPLDNYFPDFVGELLQSWYTFLRLITKL